MNIISLLSTTASVLASEYPDHLASGFSGERNYFRMSGTSMAAPMVAGAAALLLQNEPNLTPDQVKHRLMASARPLMLDNAAGAGVVDVSAAIKGTTFNSSNTGIPASRLLWSGSTPVTWSAVNWSSVNWSSVNWSSTYWGSVFTGALIAL